MKKILEFFNNPKFLIFIGILAIVAGMYLFVTPVYDIPNILIKLIAIDWVLEGMGHIVDSITKLSKRTNYEK